MSIPRHHAEWLSLLDVSGPFLSLPVLLRVFPTGLDAHEPELAKRVRSAYGEWLESQDEVAIHRAWVAFVLREVLELPEEVLRSGQGVPAGLQVTIAQQHETLRPDWVLVEPDALHKPRLLIQTVSPGQGLEKPLKGSQWAVSPATRMMELLHATGVRLGLLTNGEQWLLVNAPKGETTGFVSWYGTLWQEEPLTLRAFRSLLGVGRFFSVAEDETLAALLAESATDQQEVTDQLGYQVRQAVEVLVGAIAKLEQDQPQRVQVGSPEVLYEAVLTVMMRLVFLLCAEERGLIPSMGTEFYNVNYAVSTLRESLRSYADRHGEEILERRSDAWCRLLATFRAVYGGVDHDVLYLPAYGGSLFDPDRFAFLEGRVAGSDWRVDFGDPLAVNNRVVLHVLEALQLLQIRVPGGGVEARRMSFRALDIEQIGHVYEGLLDHTAVRSLSPVLGLKGTKYEEPELELVVLEGLLEKSEKELLKFLKEQTGRSESALKKDLAITPESKTLPPMFLQRLMTACENDRGLYERVLPFMGLLRLDTLGYPVVIGEGIVYVTAGTDRRATGTHYTPRSLTEEIVKYTLEPLVYVGPADGVPRENWQLRSAVEILQLKVCDIAMGSGAFLVQTCRYLAERLVEAWTGEMSSEVGEAHILPDGSLSRGEVGEYLLPDDPDEQLTLARRLVADRCLYGVDKNPLAVEMAKLSLWLITLAKGRPFTFVDHALKCGDSLLGLTRAEQIEYLQLNPDIETAQYPIAAQIWRPILQDAIAKRRQIEGFGVDGIEDLQEKERLFAEAERAIERLRFVGDYLVARGLAEAGKTANLTTNELMGVSQWIEKELAGTITEEEEREIAALKQGTERMMNLGNPAEQKPRKPFHWLLEFPEVFLREDAGFSAIVGNPPFQGGSKITGTVGTDYRNYLVEYVANGKKGNADLCAYFFLNTAELLQPQGRFGLVATNTIAQGDTREVGLEQLVANTVISRAIPSLPWPGLAALEVAYVWVQKSEWSGELILDEKVVNGITPFLTPTSKVIGKPYPLIANTGKSFTGNKVYGEGFVLTPEEAQMLISQDPKNKEVIFPYLGGEDLNSRFDQSASRWVINFGEMSLEEAEAYPGCLEILERLVKPYRETVKRVHTREKWWLHEHTRKELYGAIEGGSRVLFHAFTSKYVCFGFVPSKNMVYAGPHVVIALNQWFHLGLLQSTIYDAWVFNNCSTHETRLRFSPSDVFETFPFPEKLNNLETIGETYYTHRQTIMQTRQEGLTKTYNRFHNPDETSPDIQKLRELHIQMDYAVAAAYGWHDLLPSLLPSSLPSPLFAQRLRRSQGEGSGVRVSNNAPPHPLTPSPTRGEGGQEVGEAGKREEGKHNPTPAPLSLHGRGVGGEGVLAHNFHPTKQGIRFTISETVRREILDRLLQLNHNRYAEEEAQGLHDKKKKSTGKAQKSKNKKIKSKEPETIEQGELF